MALYTTEERERLAFKFTQVYGYPPSPNLETWKILRDIRRVDPAWVAAADAFRDEFGELPRGDYSASRINLEVAQENPSPPTPTEPEPVATPEPIDFQARAAALFPWLPSNLLTLFADQWAESGDPNLALAEVRASDAYNQAFPGIKRDDGSLRMSEQEWFSTREAYSRLLSDFGLNSSLFEDRFTELMEGEVSPAELAGRLGGAFEMMNTIPEVRDAFETLTGGPAVFAWFIDPDLGQAIIDKTVSIAQVAGEGLARGFDTLGSGLAERLVAGGVDQGVARNFFVQAEGQLQTLDDLVRRHNDPDDTFDLEEFADANVFGDAAQTRRIRRVLRAEASLFSPREVGSVQTRDDFALTGLSPG